MDNDSRRTDDDPWDFGGNWQYPVLKYGGLNADDQRPKVKLVLSATSTTEGGEVTLTAMLDMRLEAGHRGDHSWVIDAATRSGTHRLSPGEATIPAGSIDAGSATR